jgi:hypothetical protein
VRSAAAELPAVPLDDALEIVLLILQQEPQRFERSALRWLSRLLEEGRVTELQQAERALAYLAALPDPRRARAALEVLNVLAAQPRGNPRACRRSHR